MLTINHTAAKVKASDALLKQLERSLAENGEELVAQVKGLVVLKIDDDQWTLDLRKGTKGSLQRGVPADKPDLTLTVSDDNFAKLVMGKMNPQQAFLLRKLKIAGSMGMAMKLPAVLEAAQPKSKM